MQLRGDLCGTAAQQGGWSLAGDTLFPDASSQPLPCGIPAVLQLSFLLYPPPFSCLIPVGMPDFCPLGGD